MRRSIPGARRAAPDGRRRMVGLRRHRGGGQHEGGPLDEREPFVAIPREKPQRRGRFSVGRDRHRLQHPVRSGQAEDVPRVRHQGEGHLRKRGEHRNGHRDRAKPGLENVDGGPYHAGQGDRLRGRPRRRHVVLPRSQCMRRPHERMGRVGRHRDHLRARSPHDHVAIKLAGHPEDTGEHNGSVAPQPHRRLGAEGRPVAMEHGRRRDVACGGRERRTTRSQSTPS